MTVPTGAYNLEALLRGETLAGPTPGDAYNLGPGGDLRVYPGGHEDEVCRVINGLRPADGARRFNLSFREALGRMIDRGHICMCDGGRYRFDRRTDMFGRSGDGLTWEPCTEFPAEVQTGRWGDLTEQGMSEARGRDRA